MPEPLKRDYGPAGCCQGVALGLLGAITVLGWAAVFLGVQIVRWIA